MNIHIEWLEDSHDCDTCGPSYATGARVTLGDEVFELTPVAHCYGGQSYDDAEVFEAILEKLGHRVEARR